MWVPKDCERMNKGIALQHNNPNEVKQLKNAFNTVFLLSESQMEGEQFELSPKQNQSPNVQQYLPNDWIDKIDSVSPECQMVKGLRKISDIEYLTVNDDKSIEYNDGDDEDEEEEGEMVLNYEDKDYKDWQYMSGKGKPQKIRISEGNFKKSTWDSESNNTHMTRAVQMDNNMSEFKTSVISPTNYNTNNNIFNTMQCNILNHNQNRMEFYNNTKTPTISSNLSLNKMPPPLSLSNNGFNTNIKDHFSKLNFMQQYCEGMNQIGSINNPNEFNSSDSNLRKSSAPWIPNWTLPNQDTTNKNNTNYYHAIPKNKNKNKKKTKENEEFIIEMFGRRGWICDLCNNFNYESRSKCNRCLVPKKAKKISQLSQEFQASTMENMTNPNNANINNTHSSGSMSNNSSPKQCQLIRNSNNNTGVNNASPPNMTLNCGNRFKNKDHKGDWCCFKCNNINFSFRFVCNRCQLSKEESINSYMLIQGKISYQ